MGPITGILIDTETSFNNQMISFLHATFQTLFKTAQATLNINYNGKSIYSFDPLKIASDLLKISQNLCLVGIINKNTPRILWKIILRYFLSFYKEMYLIFHNLSIKALSKNACYMTNIYSYFTGLEYRKGFYSSFLYR